MYQAIIAPLKNVRKHPNADRVQLATVVGNQVVVGLDNSEGQMGIFFPSDGALSKDMLVTNRLYQTHPDTGEKMGGYFDKNGRVRDQKFRGEISEGFWCPLSFVEWTGIKTDVLSENYTFTELNGKSVCFKYIPKASRRSLSSEKHKNKISSLWKKRLAKEKKYPLFKEHFETKQIRFCSGQIPVGALIHISSKCHGTSMRFSYTFSRKELSLPKLIWNRVAEKIGGPKFEEREYSYVSGTRRTILNHGERTFEDPFHGGNYREKYHKLLSSCGVRKGETIYGEIVGFTDTGASIMPPHSTTKEPSVAKKYGEQILYTYGCNAEDPLKQNRLFIYRITQTNEDGDVYELPWGQVVERCNKMGLETVHVYETFFYDGNFDALLEKCEKLTQGPDPLDPRHIREGVCVRYESQSGTDILKHKGWLFKLFEGIAKDNDNYQDVEDLL